MDADPDLIAHLRRLEEELLRPEVRRSRAALEALLAPDFVEIGRSGRVYDRATIVAALASEAGAGSDRPVARIEDFTVRLLAPDVALATYRSTRGAESGAGPRTHARRSSTWRREPGGAWRLAFHQATPTT